MLRVGYPAAIPAAMLKVFPEGVELVPVSEKMEQDEEIEVWLPDPIPSRSMRTWPHLHGVKLVISLMAGTEWIPSTVGPHVTICNARGAHNISTAEWALTATLASLRYLPLYFDIQQTGIWKRRFEASAHYVEISGDKRPLYPPVLQEELHGKKVLLVGYGAIGKQIERLLAPFEVALTRVARGAHTAPEVHPVSELDSLLPQAEIVILILPSNAETKGLIGRQQIALMRQGALLVNAARGPIVDTGALVEALKAGRIRAALDVTDPEPLPEDHPLWSCPNVLITPHVAGSTPQFAPRALATAADELRRYMRGEPMQNVVQAAV